MQTNYLKSCALHSLILHIKVNFPAAINPSTTKTAFCQNLEHIVSDSIVESNESTAIISANMRLYSQDKYMSLTSKLIFLARSA